MGAAAAIKAGQAYVELTTRDGKLVKGLANAQKRLSNWGAAVTTAGTKLLAAGAAATGGFLAAGKAFADAGSAIADTADRTGLSVKAVSELGYAASISATDLGTLEGAVVKMQKKIVDAAGGSKEAAADLATFGLSAEALKNLAPDEQLAAIADGFAKITDPAEKSAALIGVFGKSGAKLGPLLSGGSAGLEEMRAKAEALGLAWDDTTARGAEAFGDSLDTVFQQTKKVAVEIGAALLPDLNALVASLSHAATVAINWIKQNQTLVSWVFRLAAGAAAAGAAIVAVGVALSVAGSVLGMIGGAITGLGTILGVIASALAFLISPIGLVIAALVGLAGYFAYSSGAAEAAVNYISEVFGTLAGDVSAAFGAISNALAAGDMAAAARVAWALIALEFQAGIALISGWWEDFKGFFVEIWHSAVNGLASIFVSAFNGIQSLWDNLTNGLLAAWEIVTGSLTQAWHAYVKYLAKTIAYLANLAGWTTLADKATALAETAAGKQKTAAQTQDANLAGIGQRNIDRQKQIDADNKAQQDALGQAAAAEKAKRQKARDAKAAAADAAVAAASAEFDAAVNDAAKLPAAAKAAARPKGPDLPNTEDIAKATPKIDVAGTFSASAVGGLGTGPLTGILEATQQTAKNTKKIAAPAFGA